MTDTAYLNLKDRSNPKRIWLEGMPLAKAGFTKGVNYNRVFDFDTGELLLVLDPQGKHKVSGREKHGMVKPIIDILNEDVVELTEGYDKIRVDFSTGTIRIAVHHFCRKQQARVQRLKDHLNEGEITEGTLCVGVGMAALATKQGLENQGIQSRCEWIVDRDGIYLDAAYKNNPAITEDTRLIKASLEELEPELLTPVDVLQVSLPCTGHSKAHFAINKDTGKKAKLKNAESHDSDALAVFGFLKSIEQINPAIIKSENVVNAMESASYALIKGALAAMGYNIHEATLDNEQSGSFEKRPRYWFIAVDSSLPQVDFANIPTYAPTYDTLGQLLSNVADDDPIWRSNQHLKDKAIRDKAAGKGFANRPLMTPESTSCRVVRRDYSKMGSTDPVVVHPVNGMERPLLPVEHAKVKSAPVELVADLPATLAHQLLGQGIDMMQGVGCSELIAKAVLKPLLGVTEEIDVAPLQSQFETPMMPAPAQRVVNEAHPVETQGQLF